LFSTAYHGFLIDMLHFCCALARNWHRKIEIALTSAN
jgi:hypothetical protein